MVVPRCMYTLYMPSPLSLRACLSRMHNATWYTHVRLLQINFAG